MLTVYAESIKNSYPFPNDLRLRLFPYTNPILKLAKMSPLSVVCNKHTEFLGYWYKHQRRQPTRSQLYCTCFCHFLSLQSGQFQSHAGQIRSHETFRYKNGDVKEFYSILMLYCAQAHVCMCTCTWFFSGFFCVHWYTPIQQFLWKSLWSHVISQRTRATKEKRRISWLYIVSNRLLNRNTVNAGSVRNNWRRYALQVIFKSIYIIVGKHNKAF